MTRPGTISAAVPAGVQPLPAAGSGAVRRAASAAGSGAVRRAASAAGVVQTAAGLSQC